MKGVLAERVQGVAEKNKTQWPIALFKKISIIVIGLVMVIFLGSVQGGKVQ